MRVVVVGTGTEVGKTFVACALCRALRGQGRGVVGLKPIESGVSVTGRAEDAHALARAAKRGPGHPLYAFERAVSPHLEARRAGVVVDLGAVRRWVEEHKGDDVTVVETAGGLLTPVSDEATNLDLTRSLSPQRVVVVAADRLGVLHDVGAVRWVLRDVGLWARAVVVLSEVKPGGESTASNAEELERLGWATRVVRLGTGDRDGTRLVDALQLG